MGCVTLLHHKHLYRETPKLLNDVYFYTFADTSGDVSCWYRCMDRNKYITCISTVISNQNYGSAGEFKSRRDFLRSLPIDNCPEDDLCMEEDRGRAWSDLDFFTLLPPLAGCLPFNDDTDITTSVDTPSCSIHKSYVISSRKLQVQV